MKEEQGQELVSTSVVNLEDRIVSKEDDMMAAFERQRFYLLRSPLWKRVAAARKLEYPQNDEPVKLGKVQADTIAKVNVLYIKGVKPTLIAFLFYCGVDFFILWRYNGGQADYRLYYAESQQSLADPLWSANQYCRGNYSVASTADFVFSDGVCSDWTRSRSHLSWASA